MDPNIIKEVILEEIIFILINLAVGYVGVLIDNWLGMPWTAVYIIVVSIIAGILIGRYFEI